MSKTTGFSGGGDVLASIRRLVADEATKQHARVRTNQTPSKAPGDAAKSDDRDWLVGAVSAGERTAVSGAALKAAAPMAAPAELAADASPDPADSVRFEPWSAPILTEGFDALPESADPKAPVRLLLTDDFRIAETETPGPVFARSSKRLHLGAADMSPGRGYSEDSDATDPVPELSSDEASEIVFRAVRSADEGADEGAESPFRAAPEQPPQTVEDLLADAGLIDEETLRILVADIVRQELQGALGERITRNVRKLVRGEIARAFEAQRLARPTDTEG